MDRVIRRMKIIASRRVSDSFPGNPKAAQRTKIHNPKWLWVVALVIAFVGLAGRVESQQAKKIQRIGFLVPNTLDSYVAFRQGLRELGYVEGKNLIIEYLKPEGNFSRASARAAELARLKVDVIVTAGASDTRAAKEATMAIPIVFMQDPDPVGNGLCHQSGPTRQKYHRVIPRWVRTYLASGWSCLKKFCPSSRVWRCLGIQPTRATEFS